MVTEQNIGISYQPISRTITAGRLNKARTEYLDGKRDVTFEAVAAVAEYVLAVYGEAPDEGMTLTGKDSGTGWEITVRRIGDAK